MKKIMLGLGSVAAAAIFLLLFLIIPFSSSYDHGRAKYSFMQHATSAPQVSHHDYIIIGGGTAGCPLAASLSKTAAVLLLERGGSPYNHPDITSVTAFGKHLSDPSPSSPAQPFVSEDGVVNARARVLGGGSCLNAGFYTRAEPGFLRAARWNPQLVNESYRWVERRLAFEPPADEWQKAVKEGLLEAGVGPDNGFTYEHRVGTKFGGTIFDGEGTRHTAADLLRNANPKGLKVFLHATVHKILFKIKGKKRPFAHGVVFRDASGNKHVAYLNSGPKNEIILSAGALGSPQLLMLSGVGPSDHLKAHNITLVLDHPFVGKAMSDNPMNGVVVPSPIPVNVSLIQAVGITNFGSYIEAAGGQAFFVPTKLDFTMFHPKIGHLSKSVEALDPPVFMGGFIIQKINGPFSTGRLRLKTKNPNDNPSVSFNYFKDPRDVNKCVRGLEVMKKVVESKAFSPFTFDFLPFSLLLNMTARAPVNLRPKHANTTESLEQFCKDTVITIWHYHGGCLVGKVVDSDYKVVGVDGLRVIDGSTFKYSPGTNPQATVMMMGRYMGVKIRRERLMIDKAK